MDELFMVEAVFIGEATQWKIWKRHIANSWLDSHLEPFRHDSLL
jgi:hypothetical protein